MIAIMLRDLRWRILALAVIAAGLYLIEPAFHQHGAVDPEYAADVSPIGISATLAYLTALSMMVLLHGFIAREFDRGFAAIHFSHPTSPLAYFGLRWVVALGVAMTFAAGFLVIGQLFAWGEFRGGGAGMLLALLTALIYGGLMAFLSAALPSGDGWVAFLLFLPTPIPQILVWMEAGLPGSLNNLLLFLLPPQHALQDVYAGLLLGDLHLTPVLFAVGYGLFWILASTLLLRIRERL